ncbi:hypothetical protein L1887_28944 [Cichorium endivia]|nr:hypothetical protein L1887_28944 [Cichorium endivia]
MSAPRLFSTHFPRTLLPPYVTSCKLNYICRDPKDVLVSKWFFMNKIRDKDLPPLSFDEAFALFCQGISDFGPIWEHVLSYWRASLDAPDKILFLKYEEVKQQPEDGVFKFGKEEVGNREFFRKGKIGDWQNYMTEEMKERIDGIIHEKLKGSRVDTW